MVDIWRCWRVPAPAGHPHIARRVAAGVRRHRPRIHRHIGWGIVCVAVPGGAIAGLVPWYQPWTATPEIIAIPEPSSLAIFATAIGVTAILRKYR